MGSQPGDVLYSIVLVDDSREIRSLVRRRLESSGFFEVVGEGGDGDEAFELVHRLQPALLLLDASMPKVDGLDALPSIIALHPETRVVMFTGFEDAGLAARLRAFGAMDVVEKARGLEELPDRLLRVLDAPLARGRSLSRPNLTVVPLDLTAGQEGSVDAQMVLNEHVERFRELFDRAAIGMAVLTLTGTVVRANPALAALMSCSTYDLVGVDYGRLTCGAGETLDGALESIDSSGNDFATFEHPLATSDGGVSGLVRVLLSPVRDAAGQVLYVFAQIQDLSAQRIAELALRRSEESFRLLVRAVDEYAIYMIDPEGVVTSWNQGAQRIKGYTAEEIIGRSFRIFYPDEAKRRGHPEQNLRAALREGAFSEEGWRTRKDGSPFWASVVISPLYDDAGKHVGFAKVTRDHTQARKDEQRRDSNAEPAERLAVTAHAMRNPTAVIDGFAGLLQAAWDQMEPDERDVMLVGIRDSADRLRHLAADLDTGSGHEP